jgi:hypothetical protein
MKVEEGREGGREGGHLLDAAAAAVRPSPNLLVGETSRIQNRNMVLKFVHMW